MRCFDIAMRDLYPFFETQLKPRHEHCEMLAAYIIPIAARPTLMRLRPISLIDKKIAGLFLIRFICRFWIGAPS